MTESSRSKTLEVMAREICCPGGCVLKPLGGKCIANEFEFCAGRALTAYESHLQAEGMAVVPGWQPIESAPKDGTRIILAWGGAAVTGSYLDNGHTAYPWKGWRVPSLELTPPGAPVAWMPFPAVPANVS